MDTPPIRKSVKLRNGQKVSLDEYVKTHPPKPPKQ